VLALGRVGLPVTSGVLISLGDDEITPTGGSAIAGGGSREVLPPEKCVAIHSWTCASLSVSSPLGPLGGSSSPQIGHSSSSGICRLGGGGGPIC